MTSLRILKIRVRRKYSFIVMSRKYSSIPAYIHIPKTGGSYVGRRGTDKQPVIWPLEYLGHIAVVDNKAYPNHLYYPRNSKNSYFTIQLKELKKYFVFSAVRNIFDWLVSYAGHAGGWTPEYTNTEHYDYENVQKGFDYLVKTIANREAPWPSRKFIFFQLFCNNGEFVPDWVTRQETLDDDLREMTEFLGLDYHQRKLQRAGKRDDYRKYYNDSLIDLVYQTWGRELDLFGYNFDRVDISSALLGNHVDETTKKLIHYDWSTNRLDVHLPSQAV